MMSLVSNLNSAGRARADEALGIRFIEWDETSWFMEKNNSVGICA